MKIKIKHRLSGNLLYAFEATDEQQASGIAMRAALEAATKSGADLRYADLSNADLSNADLIGADLRYADLRYADLRNADLIGADLRNADLIGADLIGADLIGADLIGARRATDEQAIANLDKVREVILDNKDRLDMGHWHDENSEWRVHTCAEEAMCETTHCLAGWLQVCATDKNVRAMDAQMAGILSAPVAAKMFFRQADEVLSWLDERKYVAEIAEANARREARKSAKANES